MSATNPRDEYEALAHAVDRLVRRIPWADEDTVRLMVAEEVAALANARLRTFIPAMVEARVLRRLRAPGPLLISG
ncbi:three-helix bundle dimerization domain-containing protein [Microbacterium sp. bgisy207]|jgi:uncharacterized membrane protein|uniref:three-helix bundle dimerization domain-containing protein n=1 Tax=Microbacterium sp. bgisy207 TaxID=3413800 RepID=UPI003EB9876C